MEKQTKIAYLLVFAFFIFVILHNLLCGLMRKEEIVFFFLSLATLLAFFVWVVYQTFIFVKTGKPEDWWKLGYLGLVGLLGFFPRFGPGFFGLYGFFGFFGLKKK